MNAETSVIWKRSLYQLAARETATSILRAIAADSTVCVFIVFTDHPRTRYVHVSELFQQVERRIEAGASGPEVFQLLSRTLSLSKSNLMMSDTADNVFFLSSRLQQFRVLLCKIARACTPSPVAYSGTGSKRTLALAPCVPTVHEIIR